MEIKKIKKYQHEQQGTGLSHFPFQRLSLHCNLGSLHIVCCSEYGKLIPLDFLSNIFLFRNGAFLATSDIVICLQHLQELTVIVFLQLYL